ncbi:MAG: LysM peptidoglycan-binding domain-containing protein [Bacteroidota bacterium]
MRFVAIILILSGFKLLAADLLKDSLRTEQRPDGLFVIHLVEEQETLYSLAKRYGSAVDQISLDNELQGNEIDIGQVIAIKILSKKPNAIGGLEDKSPLNTGNINLHVVQEGETLYSLSRKYNVKIKELKKWNQLEGNEISLGMKLRVSKNLAPSQTGKSEDTTQYTTKGKIVSDVKVDSLDATEEGNDPFTDFEKYLVQTGETLRSISTKIGVSLDSLRRWNQLTTDYLRIGQALFFKDAEKEVDVSIVASKRNLETRVDEDGFERTYEEGVASVIESMNTSRYLALHHSLPIGTNIEVRNLMNNLLVHVKVVGKLPDTGPNHDLVLRLSKAAYDHLGILDSKARVEISYFK